MVTWFFENYQFANAWIPFDRTNQKKLEYIYRHHEELINCILQQQQQQKQQQQQQQDSNCGIIQVQPQLLEDISNHSSDGSIQVQQHFEDNNNAQQQLRYDKVVSHKEQPPSYLKDDDLNSSSSVGINNIIKDIDLKEEDASIHQYIQYDHNCIYINLNDSHFEQEITLYPAMLLGSLPDRDILIVRAEMMDHNNKHNKYLDV